MVHLKPLFPEQVPTSNLSTPFEVGTHLRFDHGDSAQSRGPLCGGVSNVFGCCEKITLGVFHAFCAGPQVLHVVGAVGATGATRAVEEGYSKL